jgi:hypothetical protein
MLLRFCNVNVAGCSPATLAVTVYVPATALAVIDGANARPAELVTTVAELPPPLKVRLAPELGAANVTCTPPIGALAPSFTDTCKRFVNGCRTIAVCPVPPVGTIDAGLGGPMVSAMLLLADAAAGTVESLTVNWTFPLNSAPGEPVIAPVVAFRVNPEGKPVADQEYGAFPPVAVRLAE